MKKPQISPLVFPFEPLVDELAEKGYVIWDDFLTPEETALLRGEAESSFREGDFRAAGIGQGEDYQKNKRVRGDHIRWVDRATLPPAGHFFLDRLEEFIAFFNRTCFVGIRDREVHFAVYPAGAFYKRHLDVFQHKQSRKFSVICYLNDEWTPEDGGQLRLYLPQPGGGEESLDVLPRGGRLVCFQSDRFEHEVLPARRERYSLTGWLTDERPLI